MSDSIIIAAAPVVELGAEARQYAGQAKASNTRRAYRSDLQHFQAWAAAHGRESLPATPGTVADYIASLGPTHKASTIARRLVSINKAHEALRLPAPARMRSIEVSETLKGIRRTHGTRQAGKTALITEDLLRVLAELPEDLTGLRDRALLLIGFAGAFRRSELTAITVDSVKVQAEGLVITVPRSKTDQTGQGRTVAITRGKHHRTCPVEALSTWLLAAGIESGPVFRRISQRDKVGTAALHADSIGVLIKRAMSAAGYAADNYAGHSLRAGFVTQAARAGASLTEIMRQTGHASVQQVAAYVREAQLFQDAPAAKLGL